MRIDHALVLGTGMMGPGIAVTLALGGVRAVIGSRTEEGAARGLETARANLRSLVENQLLEQAAAEQAAERLSATGVVDEAVWLADLVVESVPENLELKQWLFAHLETLAPAHAVLASNTSGLSITAIASACSRPERVITTHFWNPPHIMPLVEIVRGEKTSDEIVAAMRELWQRCGKVPVVVKKDRPGQLGNRLQMALFREAVSIVEQGIADPEDVDTAAKLGFGLRLPVYGLFEHIDLVGLELAHAVCDYTARDLNSEPRAPRLFGEKIERGETGAAAGRGFYDWSVKSAAEVKARRDRFVMNCLRAGVARQRG